MAQPTNYNRQFNFSNFSTSNPSTPQPGVQLDNEYNAIELTLDQVLVNLALIQRDDGALANLSVGIDQLKPEVTLAINAVSNWTTATSYAVNAAVYQGNKIYRALVAHTSGVFATDLAAVKWGLIVDFDQYVSAAAASAAAALASETAAATSETNAAASAAALIGTSTTSLAIAVASKTFTTQSGKAFNVGRWVLCTSDADPTNYMHGQITSYSGTTLIVNVTNIGGSGTLADWTITISGTRGAVGATGAPGAGTGDMLGANNLSDVASAATSRTNLGVAIGSNVQAYSLRLDNVAALADTSGTIEKTGANTYGVYTVTAAGKALLDDAAASDQRTTLGLGTSATLNVGTGANQIVQLNGSAQLPAVSGALLTNLPAGSGSLLATTYYTMITKTCTITIASPAVVTVTAQTLPQNGAPIQLTTTGALPTGLTASTTYYVINASSTTFNLSATKGGSAINTSGSQSGTHTIKSAPFVKATNNPTFIEYEMVGGGSNGSAATYGGGAGSYSRGKILASALGASEVVNVGHTLNTASISSSIGTIGAEIAKAVSANASSSGASAASNVGGEINISGGYGMSIAVAGSFAGGSSFFSGGGFGFQGSGEFRNSGAGAGATAGNAGEGGTGLVIIKEYS